MSTGLTLAQIRELPATVDVETAAVALGIGRSTLYEWIRIGNAPLKVIQVKQRKRVITSSILQLLGDDGVPGRVLDIIRRLEAIETGNGAAPH